MRLYVKRHAVGPIVHVSISLGDFQAKMITRLNSNPIYKTDEKSARGGVPGIWQPDNNQFHHLKARQVAKYLHLEVGLIAFLFYNFLLSSEFPPRLQNRVDRTLCEFSLDLI